MIPRKISKAVIPVAGLGTRMLPVTKELPKEMLPVLSKPLIQHIVEEAIEAGISEIIFITRNGKEAIKNHFDNNYELDSYLNKKGKKDILKKLPNYIFKKIHFFSVLQKKPLGLGHAILTAEHIIQNESFAVLLPDEFLISKNKNSDLKRMLSNYNNFNQNQILVEKVPKKNISQYGVIKLRANKLTINNPQNIIDIVEKPLLKDAPSNKRVVGRYIFSSSIFKYLKKTKPGKDNEIQLTDSIKEKIKKEKNSFQATLSNSEIYDCGSLKGFVGANIASGLRDQELKKYITEILK